MSTRNCFYNAHKLDSGFPCRIDINFVIEVANFGLSESVGTKEYFHQDKDSAVKLPLKWLAPESMEDGVFTEKSDVVIKLYVALLKILNSS